MFWLLKKGCGCLILLILLAVALYIFSNKLLPHNPGSRPNIITAE